jgi:hypothetical protein
MEFFFVGSSYEQEQKMKAIDRSERYAGVGIALFWT